MLNVYDQQWPDTIFFLLFSSLLSFSLGKNISMHWYVSVFCLFPSIPISVRCFLKTGFQFLIVNFLFFIIIIFILQLKLNSWCDPSTRVNKKQIPKLAISLFKEWQKERLYIYIYYQDCVTWCNVNLYRLYSVFRSILFRQNKNASSDNTQYDLDLNIPSFVFFYLFFLF